MVHASLLDFRLRLGQNASRLKNQTMVRPLSRNGRECMAANSWCTAAYGVPAKCSPTSFAGALIEFANGMETGDSSRELIPVDTFAPVLDQHGGFDSIWVEQESLAKALDRIHEEYVGRLAAAHRALTAFLGRLLEGYKQTQLQFSVKPLKFPGHEEPCAPQDREVQAKSSVLPSKRAVCISEATAGRLLTEDLQFVSAQVLEVWKLLLGVLSRGPDGAARLLRGDWEEAMRRRWGESVFREVCPGGEALALRCPDAWRDRANKATALRLSAAYRDLPPYAVEDLSVAPPQCVHPVIFEQRYEAEEPMAVGPSPRFGLPSPTDGGLHLFVLVHGFQGHSADMQLLKNNISLFHPRAVYLCSATNEEDTEGDIEQMGANLAAEVIACVQDMCNDASEPSLGRLSFITHSAGGLIVRSALPFLAEFHEKMFTFMSFSSPHLGYMYAPTALFKTGIWVVSKVRQSQCLEQLRMTDSPDPASSFIGRLSKTAGLQHFRYVVLISSHQDQYSPFESARIEMSSAAENDPKFGPFYAEMVRNILCPLDVERIYRFDMNLHIPGPNLDSMIGRAAHIQFIESQLLMRMFVHTHSLFFG